jgi:hypothetical protein
MSGWVRPHQKPTPEIKVTAIQVAQQHDRLALYDRQGRPANDPNRLHVMELLDYIA